MNFEEKEIHDYLKPFGKQFVSAREIGRRAGGKKRFSKNPHWAVPILNGMVEKKILESDSMSHYRVLPDEREKKRKQWMSPEIEKLLKANGKGPEEKEEQSPVIEIESGEPGEPQLQ